MARKYDLDPSTVEPVLDPLTLTIVGIYARGFTLNDILTIVGEFRRYNYMLMRGEQRRLVVAALTFLLGDHEVWSTLSKRYTIGERTQRGSEWFHNPPLFLRGVGHNHLMLYEQQNIIYDTRLDGAVIQWVVDELHRRTVGGLPWWDPSHVSKVIEYKRINVTRTLIMEYVKERSLHQHDIDYFDQNPIKRPPTLAARIDDAMLTLAVQIEEQPPRDFMKDVKNHMNKAMDLSAAAGRGDLYAALKAVLVMME
jgi:hypothetical protein